MSRRLVNFLTRFEDEPANTTAPSAIFGTVGQMSDAVRADADVRIAFYPCIVDDQAQIDVVMGLWKLLQLSAGRGAGYESYFIAARVDDGNGDEIDDEDDIDSETSDASAATSDASAVTLDSQFTVDDWQMESLNETVLVWGSLTHDDGVTGVTLTVSIDDDAGEGDDEVTLTYSAPTVAELVSHIPQMKRDLLSALDVETTASLSPTDDALAQLAASAAPSVSAMLASLFEWERALFLLAGGYDDDEDPFEPMLRRFIAALAKLPADLQVLVLGHILYQTSYNSVADIGEMTLDVIYEAVMMETVSDRLNVPIAASEYELGYVENAFETMQDAISSNPGELVFYTGYASLLSRSGYHAEAANLLRTGVLMAQSGSESTNVPATAVDRPSTRTQVALLWQYARQLATAQGLFVDDNAPKGYVFIDAGDDSYENVHDEIIATYNQLLTLLQADAAADEIYTQVVLSKLLYQIDDAGEVYDESVYRGDFERLMQADQTGGLILNIVQTGEYEIDPHPLLQALQSVPHPQTIEYQFAEAILLHLVELNGQSLALFDLILTDLESQDRDRDAILLRQDVEAWRLRALDPEVEMRLGQIEVELQQERQIGGDDILLLEKVLEEAPYYYQGYLLYAHAVALQGLHDTAVQTLEQAIERYPLDTQAYNLSAQYLEAMGHTDEALIMLQKGLDFAHNNVSLLVTTCRILFDHNQRDAAREYAAFAERVAPRSNEVATLKRYIATNID